MSPHSRPWARHAERVAEHEGLSRLVLAYVAAVAVAIGVMVALMHRGW